MLAYMALVIRIEHKDICQIHEMTYKNAKEHVPEREYGYLLGSPDRKVWAENPAAFYDLLPYYAVKPFYIGMVYLFNKTGFSLPISTVLPSILFYLLIGILLFHWLKNYLDPFRTFAASLLVMYAGFMISVARGSTPDCMSAFLLLMAFYFMLERRNPGLTFLFLILSVYARLDNIVISFLMISFLFFFKKSPVRVNGKQYAIMGICLGICFFSITWLLRPFGWNPLFYHEFSNHLPMLKSQGSFSSLSSYLSLAYSKIIASIVENHFILFLLALLFIVASPPKFKFKDLSSDQLFALLLFIVVVARFILFPDLSDRFNIANYICAFILLIKKYSVIKLLPASNE